MVKPIETIPEGVKHIHCIGIGGSGMFPLVQILHGRGYTITGSDNNESDIVNLERQMGIEVMMGQRAENIRGADLILYSAAIMETNPELIAARESGLPLWERAKMLGAVSSWYSEALGVCGTHGKTTTTAMIVQILYMAGPLRRHRRQAADHRRVRPQRGNAALCVRGLRIQGYLPFHPPGYRPRPQYR